MRDPELRAALARLASDVPSSPPADVDARRALASALFRYWNDDPPSVGAVDDVQLDVEGRRVALRRYRSGVDTGAAGLVYLHGGGWIVGDLDFEDRALRLFARDSGLTVLSVDYPLAPEHPYPEARDTVAAVFRRLLADCERFSIDPARLALGGASAGANLALSAALALRDAAAPACLMLWYGVFDCRFDSRSHETFGGGEFLLSSADMEGFLAAYIGADGARDDPGVSPVHADLAGLPPVHLMAAELDPLLDDSSELAARLTRAGVPCELTVAAGMVHGFTQFSRSVAAARRAITASAQRLAATLSDAKSP